MNKPWLLNNADIPIRYIISKSSEDKAKLLQNYEVSAWFSRLTERSKANIIGDIHGSHDYRMENILGKCWILGLSRDIPVFKYPSNTAPHKESLPDYREALCYFALQESGANHGRSMFKYSDSSLMSQLGAFLKM